jgi:hypothetical protein
VFPTYSCPDLSLQRREARKQEQANNPFYIKSSPSPQKVRCSCISLDLYHTASPSLAAHWPSWKLCPSEGEP